MREFQGQQNARQATDGECASDLFQRVQEILILLTGSKAENADHIYRFLEHLKSFQHPHPREQHDEGGGTVMFLNSEYLTEIRNLQGSESLTLDEVAHYQNVFDHFPPEHRMKMYFYIFRRLGRAPRVEELAEELNIHEGNEPSASSRMTPGKLLIENECLLKRVEIQQSQITAFEREQEADKNEICLLRGNNASLQREHIQIEVELEDERHDRLYLQVNNKNLKRKLKHRNVLITFIIALFCFFLVIFLVSFFL